QSVSYFFLFCFGVKLISDSKNQNFFWWVTLPTVAFLGWLAEFSHFITLVGTNDLVTWLIHSECWSRYLLALPAGVFTAYGLALQIPETAKLNDSSVMRNLWAATVAFAFFAVFSGMVVPLKMGWVGQVINAVSFRHYTGLPVEVFRTATALLATWSITRMLGIFDLEKQRHVAESRRLETVYRERERFARDLHDDVIQSIFGVGLELQTTINMMEKDSEKAAGQVSSSITKLNKVIHTLRAYIHGLETESGGQDLKTQLADMVTQFRGKTGLQIKLNFQLYEIDKINLSVDVEDWQQQLQQIIREALNNIVRHAKASKAQVDIRTEGNQLVVIVKDNGRGLPVEKISPADQGGNHLGMRNMRARARLLGGDLQLFSRPGEGTRLVISIPLEFLE
ncbi:MAG: sensor histidine kinase, partial [Eubacteriales bacterium]